jgi:NitT/TauT family transport system permease protein
MATVEPKYFHFKGETFSVRGLGATISHATNAGDFKVLLAATVVMAAVVVTINRIVWHRLYRLAATRFQLTN